MTLPFRSLPSSHDPVLRPLVDISVIHDDGVEVMALCDTGTLHNRFGRWVADLIDLDVAGIEPQALGVGGQHVLARTATVRLRLGEVEWEAPVSFCEPWPWSFHLLGQEGFFRWFDIGLRTADREMDLTPITA